MLFATTEEFLRRFGIGTTEDLPGLLPEQEEEIKSEVAAELQMDVNELEQEEQQIKLQEGGREAKKEDKCYGRVNSNAERKEQEK